MQKTRRTVLSTIAAGLIAGAVAMLTFILNFIPTIGSIIATVIAVVLVLAQTGDPTLTLVIGGACTLVHFVIGNVLDPLLLGQTLRLSSFGMSSSSPLRFGDQTICATGSST